MNRRFCLSTLAASLSLLAFSTTKAEIQLPAPTTPMITINQAQSISAIAASLFIISSNTAVLSSQKNKDMILTLQNVGPYVTKFTAIPDRKASLSTTEDTIHDWVHNRNTISSSPPSATLAGVPISGGNAYPNYILDLSNPVYDSKRATLSFKVKWTGGSPAPLNAITLTNVSLVIDDGLQIALNANISALRNSLLASAKV